MSDRATTVSQSNGSFEIHVDSRAALTDPSRTPLVLLHAFPVGPTMWNSLVESLAGPAMIVHLPGFGESAVPPGEASLEDAADAIARYLSQNGVEKIVVAGVSMGGYVALALAEQHPELIAGIGLLDTRLEADTEQARQGRYSTIDQVKESGVTALTVSGLVGRTTAEYRPDVLSKVEELARDANPHGVMWALEAMARRPDRTHVMLESSYPALLLAGDEDSMSPLEVLTAPLAHRSNVEAVQVPGAGHLSAMEEPKVVAEALETLVNRSEA